MNTFWDYVNALRARFYVVIPAALAGALLALAVAQIQHKQYRATTRLLIESNRPRLISADAEGAMRTSDHTELQTQALLVRSQDVARRTILKLSLRKAGPFKDAESDESLIAALLDSVRVTPVRDTRFLEISCETTNAEWAAKISLAMAESYIQENFERRRERLGEVTGIYSQRYPELDKKRDETEAALMAFQQKYLVVSSEDPVATLKQRELKLLDQLSQAQQDRISSQAKLMQLKTETTAAQDASMARAIAAEDPWVRNLLQARLNQAARLVELRQNYSDGHRELETAKKRMQEIQKELGDAIKGFSDHARRKFESAKWKEEEIQRILDEHRDQIAALRKVLAQYEALRRKHESIRMLLDPLYKSGAELELAKSMDVATSTIVDRAVVPQNPSRPVKLNYVIVGFVLGLLLGVRVAFALEAADATVRTRENIREMIALESVGTVLTIDTQTASSPQLRARALVNLPSSPAAEQFRSLRTSILAAASWKEKDRGGVVLVTSSSPGEGKSFVSANTAEAFAQLGKPVLLIDADLRRGTVHELFECERSPGLTDYLEGKAKLDEILRKTDIGNLTVIPAGDETSRPAELLGSVEMRSLIQKVRTEYDTVWIDTPPVNPVADARDVVPMADLVLLVVRSGRTRQKSLIQARDLIHLTQDQKLAAVVNDMSKSTANHYGYYRRGYGYGYGYSAREPDASEEASRSK